MECKICLKKFSNGKAVGAHMKSHFAPYKLPRLPETVVSSAECKICFKKFSNGKAVGAHMKSHFAPLQLPLHLLPKTPPGQQLGTESPTESDSFLAGGYHSEVEEEGNDAKRTKKLKQILDPELVAAAHDSVESELTRGVEKQQLKQGLGHDESSSSLTEFDVASCLMTLSRDVWVSSGNGNAASSSCLRPPDSVSDDSDGPSRKTRYQCDICKRFLKKPQALATHRKTHEKKLESGDGPVRRNRKTTTKKKNKIVDEQDQEQGEEVHECEFCEKVFMSVFGLAGHRRWHLALLGKVGDGDGEEMEIQRCSTVSCNSIDLNLPPPVEQDGEEEINYLCN